MLDYKNHTLRSRQEIIIHIMIMMTRISSANTVASVAIARSTVIFCGLQLCFTNSDYGGSAASSTAHRWELAALLAPRHPQNLPARRAGRMGRKPRIYATHMEPVAALRQNPDLVAAGEFLQANRAFRCRHPLIRVAINVTEFRQRLKYFLLQPLVGKSLPWRPAGARGRSRARNASEPRTARDSHEAHDAYKGAKKSCQNHDEV